MKFPAEVKPALWGAVGGAILIAFIGFTWGGWMTGAQARDRAEKGADAAVVAALAPICAIQFRAQSDASVKLAELTKLASYDQAPFVEKGGWATMPGTEKPLTGVARGCLNILVPTG
jgi:hypothetical protein